MNGRHSEISPSSRIYFCVSSETHKLQCVFRPGVAPYMGYMGMCGAKGDSFLALLV